MLFGFGPAAIIMAVIMILALIGMIICAKKQDVTPLAKPAAIACMVVIVICAFGILATTGMFGDASVKKIIANEMVYSKASVFIPGKYIGEKYSGSKILLLIDDEKVNNRQKELIDEFKRGLAGKCKIIGMECPKPAPQPTTMQGESESQEGAATPQTAVSEPETSLPIQELMTAQSVSETIAKYPEADMIVTLVGLPRNLEEMDIWWEEDETKKKKVALLSGEISKLKHAIMSGQVVAAVTYHPHAKFDDSKAPSDPQQAFNKRYLLITPENVEEIASQFKNIFIEE